MQNDLSFVANSKFMYMSCKNQTDDCTEYRSNDNTEYILWRVDDNYLILFNPDTEYISGKKRSEDYWEQLGGFIDYDRKIINWRICKNGSTNISEAFTKYMFGKDAPNKIKEKYLSVKRIFVS